MAQTASDLVWLQQFFSELHIPSSTPHGLWCDNKSAIALACNPVFHARTKHIELDYHFIREQVLNRQIVLYHISSEAQLANIFTKALSVSRFQLLKSKLMVANPPIRLRGGVKEKDTAIPKEVDTAAADLSSSSTDKDVSTSAGPSGVCFVVNRVG